MIGINTRGYVAGVQAAALALLASPAWAESQQDLGDGERAADLRARSHPIVSIDPTIDRDDFADLEPLKQAIGDSRVVWLGEQSHGEGAAFLTKSRLVKFLHQEMGFDVLVWETGMASAPLVDEAMRDPDRTAAQAAAASIFPIWRDAAQVKPLLGYVKRSQATDRPIITAGIDAQLTGREGDYGLRRQVEELFQPVGVVPAGALDFATEMQAFWADQTPERGLGVIASLERSVKLIADAQPALEAAHEPWRVGFVQRCLSDAASFVRTRVAYIQAGNNITKVDHDLLSERDRRMGDNLVFLANEVYPEKKLIVWAATFHGMYDLREVTYDRQPGMYDTMFAAGITAHQELGDDLYHVAFIAEGGEVGSVFSRQPRRIPPRPAGSVENLLDSVPEPFLFMDLRGLPTDHWLREPTVMAPLGNQPMTAVWPDQFDAFISIEAEFPASRTELAPPGFPLTVGG